MCAATYVFLAVSMPIALDLVESSAERRFAHDIHQSVATLFVFLLVLRFSWIAISGTSGLKTVFQHRWQFWMARLNHSLLYLLMVATPLSGFGFKLTSGKPLLIFGYEFIAAIPSIENEDWEYYISEFHFFIISVFYVLIFLHIAGALMHLVQSYFDRHGRAV